MNDDLVSRQAALEALEWKWAGKAAIDAIKNLPTARPTLDGYSIECLVFIAKLLAKENLPPERVSDALSDIGRVVAIVRKEYEEAMRKAVEQCMM